MTNTTSLAELKEKKPAPVLSDTRVDMFSMQGFALANRIANAYASSDAVPAQFRSHVLKKVGNTEQWVENPSALGNCIVAIEVAQAVGTSIASVMQNADVIEGKLRWSGKFVIAAINASRRFSPLRFDTKNLGKIKAKYREKTGWDNNARKPIFEEREVELENLQCVAWALPVGVPFPPGVYTLDQARAAGLPVIESAPVSMKMAVEEGWYSKPGSKWQTELKFMMLQYRAGTFFGNIHAPDIVMGMGPTVEEERDVLEMAEQPDGSFAVNLDSLRPSAPAPQAKAETVIDAHAHAEQATTTAPADETPAQASAAGDDAAQAEAKTAEKAPDPAPRRQRAPIAAD